MGEDDNGNKGATALEQFEKDAIANAAATMAECTESGNDAYSAEQRLGVLQRAITAVLNDTEYRQILLLAAFDNKQEAMLASDSIDERERYGAPIKPILNRISAQCGVKSGRLERVLSAMTTHSLQTNYGSKLPSWKRKQEDKSIT